MSSNNLIVDIPLSGASGTAMVIVPGRNVVWGFGWSYQLRVLSSDYTFTAFEMRATRYPKNLVSAGVTLNAMGEPTSNYDPFATAPDELVFHKTGNQAPGAAAAQAAFYSNFPGANRRLAVGPLCIGCQWTSGAGSAAVIRASFEFLNFDT